MQLANIKQRLNKFVLPLRLLSTRNVHYYIMIVLFIEFDNIS